MSTRVSAAQRRDDVLNAALIEFAERGLDGTSTEAIARRAGISQPYVFRLFGTKKELFRAATERCFREALELFQRAADGKRGEEALRAIGDAYIDETFTDPIRLPGQMHVYVASSDPEIRQAVRIGYGNLVAYAGQVSGLPPERISNFFATGMLLSALASMQVQEGAEQWAATLLEGCRRNRLGLGRAIRAHGGGDQRRPTNDVG
jgi:AcrR family transcriptional regulator